jgi:hypothetical protein
MLRPALALCLALAPIPGAAASPPTALRGQCHMDQCIWERELSRREIGRSPRGVLYELRKIYGFSRHPQGSYERPAPVKWRRTSDTEHVFCSKTLPVVLRRDEGKLTGTLFDLRVGGNVYGFQWQSFYAFKRVCHGLTPDDQTDLDAFARRYGYRASEALWAAEEPRLKRPEDVLR